MNPPPEVTAKIAATTTIAQTLAHPASTFPIDGGTAGGLFGAISFLVAGLLWLRQRTSKVDLDVQTNRSEGVMLKTALEDRDKAMREAREAWDRRANDAQEIGQLRAANNYLAGVQEENKYLKSELAITRDQLNQIRRGVQSVGQIVDATKSNLDRAEQKVSDSGLQPLIKLKGPNA